MVVDVQAKSDKDGEESEDGRDSEMDGEGRMNPPPHIFMIFASHLLPSPKVSTLREETYVRNYRNYNNYFEELCS